MEEPEEAVTQQEVWRSNYADNESHFLAAVLAALAVGKVAGDGEATAVGACTLMLKEKPLALRVKRVPKTLQLEKQPAFAQSLQVLDVTVADVCPELATPHADQVEVYETAQKKAAAKRKSAAAKKAKLERQRLERDGDGVGCEQ